MTNLSKLSSIQEASIQDSNILELLICSSLLLVQPCEWSQRKTQYFDMVTKLCGASKDLDVMLLKENKYLLNLLALISLIYKGIESPKFSKKLVLS